jgi:hypothetical protein
LKKEKAMNEKPIPAGYRQDAKGNLIPEANIKELDKLRDTLVLGIVKDGRDVARVVEAFKVTALKNIQAFCDIARMEYDAPLGGKKGNVTLFSFDGRFKVIRAVDENIAFNEQLEAAKALIDECLTDWTRDSSDNIKAIVNQAFQMNKAGEISTARVLGLRSIKIEDPRWLRAMDAIANSVTIVGSKTYVRLYERVGDSDEYQQIALS